MASGPVTAIACSPWAPLIAVAGQKQIVLFHSDTGEVLDEDMTTIATLEANRVKEKLSICSVTTGDAAAIEKGMTIHIP